MRIYYISPSIMPSRSANSIHVARMCEAFSYLGNEVDLFLFRPMKSKQQLRTILEEYYGVSLKNVRLISCFGRSQRAVNIRIAATAVCSFLSSLLTRSLPDLIISRNLYASFIIGVLFRRRIFYETHYLELGIRKCLQGMLIKQPKIITIVISKALQKLLVEWHGVSPAKSVVLHDAAPANIERLSHREKDLARNEFLVLIERGRYKALSGYFGHLYPGRGIEIIQEIAVIQPEVGFFVFGGNDKEIVAFRESNRVPNLHLMGYLHHSHVLQAMRMMDVLLLPYQRTVSIGVNHHDTGKFMSPLKMFEYMAAGVPIIASRLPVLEEVLIDKHNCLMAEPADSASWSACLNRLLRDSQFAEELAAHAHMDYELQYNWLTRAQKMLEVGDMQTIV